MCVALIQETLCKSEMSKLVPLKHCQIDSVHTEEITPAVVCLAGSHGESYYILRTTLLSIWRFAKGHMDKPEGYWKEVIDDSKRDYFGVTARNCIGSKTYAAFKHRNHTPTVNNSGGSRMVQGCSAACRDRGGLQSLTELWCGEGSATNRSTFSLCFCGVRIKWTLFLHM